MSISSEIVSTMKNVNINFESLIISNPDLPTPTSFFLTKKFYPNIYDSAKKIQKLLNVNFKINFKENNFHDIPNQNFKGPF